jgi:predicted N-acetyltransferase YhbS
MANPSVTYRLELPQDFSQIDLLHQVAFGPGRFIRAAFLLRERTVAVPELSISAFSGDQLIGSVRHTEICIGQTGALLLGPLAVHPQYKHQGIGKSLLGKSITAAREFGARVIILVGDEPYYAPFGFKVVPPGRVILPAPVDPARLLAVELEDGAAVSLRGRAMAGRR